MVLSLFFTSCNLLSDDDSGTLSIRLPPITDQSRSISSERIETLKNLTVRYRVTVNGMEREGSGAVYEFTLPVGTVARITVECLNSRGEVIVRATKEHTVTGGDNNVSIILKNDGDEIINDGVTYSYGDAAAGGAVTGFPQSVKVAVGEKFTVTGDANSITWDYGTFVEWKTNVALKGDADSGTSDVAAGDSVPVGTYIMPDGNVTITAQWQKKQYIITYNTNSPAGANVSSVANLPMTDALTHVTLATAPTVTNNPVTVGNDQKNYTFLYWQDTSDGTTYSAGTQITLTKSMTLEAVWSDKNIYTVTFEKGNNSPAEQSISPALPQPATAEENTATTWINPGAKGYTFEGWTVSDAGNPSASDLSASTTSYTPQGNTTLTAKWSATPYTISVNGNGAAGALANPFENNTYSINGTNGSQQIPLNNSVPSNGDSVYGGKMFDGWSYTAGGTKINGSDINVSALLEEPTAKISGSVITLYAVWKNAAASVTLGGTETNYDDFDAVVSDVNSSSGAVIKLYDDVTVSAQVLFTADCTLDLNNHQLIAQTGIKIESGTFTLEDNSTAQAGKITGLTSTTKNSVHVIMGATFIMNSGNISDNDSGGTTMSPAVYIDSGTFIMYGGSISNNFTTSGGPGVMCDGAFTMYDGTISGNSTAAFSALKGGGVYVLNNTGNGSFTMKGGTISGNSANTGGGVYIGNYATFTMEGGTISENTADNGGGVYIYGTGGTFTFDGGSIIDNTATDSGGGGGVYRYNGIFNGNGTGTMSGNTPQDYSGSYSGTATDNSNSWTHD